MDDETQDQVQYDEPQASQDNDEPAQNALAQAEAEARANLDGWKRTLADFENYKKRKESENAELVEFAKEVTVTKLLPILDSLEQGLRHLPNIENEQLRTWQAGIEATLRQLDDALGHMGVVKIEAVGKKFDPHFHEAVKEVPGEEDGMVTEELQTGFALNGKVIRPSQVVISKQQS
jgi:molecular chaperone GrpE